MTGRGKGGKGLGKGGAQRHRKVLRDNIQVNITESITMYPLHNCRILFVMWFYTYMSAVTSVKTPNNYKSYSIIISLVKW